MKKKDLEQLLKINSLTRYDGLSYKDYNQVRRAEKPTRIPRLNDEKEARDKVWYYLLGSKGSKSEIFKTFLKKVAYNSGGDKKVLKESIRHYMSLFNNDILTNASIGYADLTSAYPTALACANYSLKYHSDFRVDNIDELGVSAKGIYSITRLHMVVRYAHTLNLFTNNERIRLNGEKITRMPRLGEEVEVMIDLYKCDDLQIDSIKHFFEYFPRDMIVKVITHHTYLYTLVKRPQIYSLDRLSKILLNMHKLRQNDRANVKNALVSFAGQLSIYEPSRRLIMLTMIEQVMLDSIAEIGMNSVHGCYIDAIYFDKNDVSVNTVTDIIYKNAVRIYKLPKDYNKELVIKGEIIKNNQYTTNEFTIRGIYNGQ